MKLGMLPLFAVVMLIAECAGDFVSTDPGSTASVDSSPSVDTSSVDSFNETQQRINDQMAMDAANAAAAAQNNAAMAAAQETMNNANAQFNQNGLQ